MTLERKAHQLLVDALLEELAAERRELYRRKAFGARRGGLRDLKGDYQATLQRLASLTTGPRLPARSRRRSTVSARPTGIPVPTGS